MKEGSMDWKQTIAERNEIVLVTSSLDGVPHAIIAISLGLVDEKILIGACVMKITLDNIRKNNKVVVVAKGNGEYYRLRGTIEIHTSGKYFDLAYGKSSPPMPQSALMFKIEEVFDLDKQTKVL
jgi:hypothetical protein